MSPASSTASAVPNHNDAPANSATALLRIAQLGCERAGRGLFSNLNLAVQAGELIEITGPNGSGKSTLLRIVAGLAQSFSGDIFWRGEALVGGLQRQHFQQHSLYCGHSAAIKPALTVLENLRFSTRLKAPFDKDRALDALARLQLQDCADERCHRLSAGQQRRVSLARLLMVDARLWLLDEPLTALDEDGVTLIESLCQQQLDAGGAVLLATHQALGDIRGKRRLQLGLPDGSA